MKEIPTLEICYSLRQVSGEIQQKCYLPWLKNPLTHPLFTLQTVPASSSDSTLGRAERSTKWHNQPLPLRSSKACADTPRAAARIACQANWGMSPEVVPLFKGHFIFQPSTCRGYMLMTALYDVDDLYMISNSCKNISFMMFFFLMIKWFCSWVLQCHQLILHLFQGFGSTDPGFFNPGVPSPSRLSNLKGSMCNFWM